MNRNSRKKYYSRPSGFTLLELMVSLSLAAILFAGIMSQYSSGASLSYDQGIRIATNLQVQAILQTIGSEIRILGNGVPFDQANFQIGEDTLSDVTVTEPILVAETTATHIAFRLNETGGNFLLVQDFNPAVSLDVFLTDVSDLDANDPIYISNSVMSGDEGLYGVIESVDEGTSSVTLTANYITTVGATFDMGSIFEEVPIVRFDSPMDGSGITRNSGFGGVLMGANTTMALDFLDVDGNSIGLPLTHAALVGSLRAINVTVTMQSSKSLSTGIDYNASASQTFGIRNLNYAF